VLLKQTHTRGTTTTSRRSGKGQPTAKISRVYGQTAAHERTTRLSSFGVGEKKTKNETHQILYHTDLPLLIIFDLMIYFNMKKFVVLFNPNI
jgi:hypothetical protein